MEIKLDMAKLWKPETFDTVWKIPDFGSCDEMKKYPSFNFTDNLDRFACYPRLYFVLEYGNISHITILRSGNISQVYIQGGIYPIYLTLHMSHILSITNQ
jgi:hypothetical protein